MLFWSRRARRYTKGHEGKSLTGISLEKCFRVLCLFVSDPYLKIRKATEVLIRIGFLCGLRVFFVLFVTNIGHTDRSNENMSGKHKSLGA
ncbi:hypothetical protein SBDP1_160020 [Syntrophobacter sp. SbD1]|nr:hypothetical protein SBDP1_160020 [Syntrophobacter sp. SbD1]